MTRFFWMLAIAALSWANPGDAKGMPSTTQVFESSPKDRTALAYQNLLKARSSVDQPAALEARHAELFPIVSALWRDDEAAANRFVTSCSHAATQDERGELDPMSVAIWMASGEDKDVLRGLQDHQELAHKLAAMAILAVDGPHETGSDRGRYGEAVGAVVTWLANPSPCRLRILQGLMTFSVEDGPVYLVKYMTTQVAVDDFYKRDGCQSRLDGHLTPSLSLVLNAFALNDTFTREKPERSAKAFARALKMGKASKAFVSHELHGLSLISALHALSDRDIMRLIRTYSRLDGAHMWAAPLMSRWGTGAELTALGTQVVRLDGQKRRAAAAVTSLRTELWENDGFRRQLKLNLDCILAYASEHLGQLNVAVDDPRAINEMYEIEGGRCKSRKPPLVESVPVVGAIWKVSADLYHDYPVSTGEMIWGGVEVAEIALLVATWGGSAPVSASLRAGATGGKIVAKKVAKSAVEKSARSGARRLATKVAGEAGEATAKRAGRLARAGRAGKGGLVRTFRAGQWVISSGRQVVRTAGTAAARSARALKSTLGRLSPVLRRRVLVALLIADLTGRTPAIAGTLAVGVSEWADQATEAFGKLFELPFSVVEGATARFAAVLSRHKQTIVFGLLFLAVLIVVKRFVIRRAPR